MPFHIVRQDITKARVDAIVNAANTDLAMGGGVCGAIFAAAGAAKLQAACNRLAPIKTGQAALTPGFGLDCKYIIHTAGPVYQAQDPQKSERLLRAAYRSALLLAWQNGCKSVAFPLISSGIYGYPKEEALRVACSAIRTFLMEQETQEMDVTLMVFDKTAFVLSRSLLGRVADYIDEHYVSEQESQSRYRALLAVEKAALSAPQMPTAFCAACDAEAVLPNPNLESMIGHLDEPFSQTLLRLIDAKGRKDSEVYKRANLDRKLFSKIRIGKGYMPGKRTVLALCVALELDLAETNDLLKRAGYALSPSQLGDVIVAYFIDCGRWNIDEINETLFHYDQQLLGN